MTLTEEQVAIKRMVADFARNELAEHAFKPESEEQYRGRLHKLAASGRARCRGGSRQVLRRPERHPCSTQDPNDTLFGLACSLK